jgi:hypothetical protein
MAQLTSNRRHWHALYVAELAAGVAPAAVAKPPADRDAERGRAAARLAAFETAYAVWMPAVVVVPAEGR